MLVCPGAHKLVIQLQLNSINSDDLERHSEKIQHIAFKNRLNKIRMTRIGYSME